MAKARVDTADGRTRCAWAASDPLLAAYHDLEWGRPIRTDAGHLERMSLEVFQCGLSWKIVLVKRAAFRRAFEGFDPSRVARFGRREIDRLCRDSSIIRNRRKLEAVVENARTFLEIRRRHRSYCRWFGALPAGTGMERAALYPLYRETFRFMGPETTKCYLMGVGKIDPEHDARCWLHAMPARA
jgi:DNA-3-methyladenine glycosylase I